MKPLVSILIPAYNAQEYIADALRSALAQTWSRKEIIVVDDGSRDRTLDVARQFQSNCLTIVAQDNQGAAAARNKALSLSQGDYIQYLDADDVLAPDKITRQIESIDESATSRTLVSCSWGAFFHRYYEPKFIPTPLWTNLSPLEWMIRKMELGVWMVPGCWLVSRELTEAAGLWDTSLQYDDDGEYFCRVLLASDSVRFVPEAKVYYRKSGSGSLGYIGSSNKKVEGLWCSIQRHITCLRSLDDSERARAACVRFLQRYLIEMYPERLDIVEQAEELARQLGGRLVPPLSWNLAELAVIAERQQSFRGLLAEWFCFFVKAMFGWRAAKRVRLFLPNLSWPTMRLWDKALFVVQSKRREIFWNGPTGNHDRIANVSTPPVRGE
jgi:glycosyltransferase involved in cell wall biosynthesis